MKYLVDLGPLLPVHAVSPWDALDLALLQLGCTEIHVDEPAVYEFDRDGSSLLRRIPVQTFSEGEHNVSCCV